MATIRDVAKMANVSVATVSRVLNKSSHVSEKTKRKVENAIKTLNYRPNEVARSLFKGKSKMISLFVPDITNPFFPELARAVEDIANEYGYTFILCNTDNDNDKEVAYLNALLQKSIDGILIVSNTIQTEQVKGIDVPIISLDRKIDSNIISITANNRKGAQQAVRYLKKIGCKQIAHLAGPQHISSAKDRKLGYIDEVSDESWFSKELIYTSNYTMEDAYKQAKTMLTTHPDIDGIFVSNDLMAVGVLKAAHFLEINVPKDLSVIGFDGIKLGKTTSPSLTTVKQPIYEIGQKAAKSLIQKINDPEAELASEVLDVQLIVRESTKGCALQS